MLTGLLSYVLSSLQDLLDLDQRKNLCIILLLHAELQLMNETSSTLILFINSKAAAV
jgi:hypothetical protein